MLADEWDEWHFNTMRCYLNVDLDIATVNYKECNMDVITSEFQRENDSVVSHAIWSLNLILRICENDSLQ